MHSGDVSRLSNIAGELIQFAGECDLSRICACVGLQRETICSRDHRVGKNDVIRVEECFQRGYAGARSEEHTSELQSRLHLVCRLLLEKKKQSRSTQRTCHLTTSAMLPRGPSRHC